MFKKEAHFIKKLFIKNLLLQLSYKTLDMRDICRGLICEIFVKTWLFLTMYKFKVKEAHFIKKLKRLDI